MSNVKFIIDSGSDLLLHFRAAMFAAMDRAPEGFEAYLDAHCAGWGHAVETPGWFNDGSGRYYKVEDQPRP